MAKDTEIRDTNVAVAEPAEPAAPPPKQEPGVLPMIVIGALLIVVSVGVTLLAVKMMMPGASTSTTQTKKEKKEGGAEAGSLVYNLSEIFVNIAETKGTRVIKINPHLVVSEAALIPELEKSMPMILDRVSEATSKMTLDELEGANGRRNLKREIMQEVNNAIKDKMAGAVVDVYFSDFLIQ